MADQQQITLTRTEPADLETLFQFQLDEEAGRIAAFTAKDPGNKAAYLAKHTPFLSDPTKHTRTIRVQDVIVGSIAKFLIDDEAEITYWIDRKYWGRGIATAALSAFLELEKTRPLYGRTAFDNIGSQKVLEHCGFVRVGADRGFANARSAEIEEYIYRLD